jgi:hypothetical protein
MVDPLQMVVEVTPIVGLAFTVRLLTAVLELTHPAELVPVTE